MAKLTAKQKRFVQEYLVDFNATQAAIRSGYSQKTAGVTGAENLRKPYIQAEICKRQLELQEKTEITQEKVINEIASIAFAKVTDFVNVKYSNTHERNVVFVEETINLKPSSISAIAGIKEGANGIEVKLHDKIKALELLGKRLGLWENKIKEETEDTSLIDDEIFGDDD